MTAAHLVRPAARPRTFVPPAELAARYQPGHFTALMRRHDWPPAFEPQLRLGGEPDYSAISRASRERRVEMGDTGTMTGLSLRADEIIARRLLVTRGTR